METWQIITGILLALGAGTIIPRQWDKWFPSKGDEAKTQADLTTTIESAISINGQLTMKLKEMVEEKTQVLQNILIRREGEYHIQIKENSKLIFDLQEREKKWQEEIAQVRNESLEYQKQILTCYKDLTEERRLKEKYFEEKQDLIKELQEAKEHIVELEKRVGQLEKKNNDEKNISNR